MIEPATRIKEFPGIGVSRTDRVLHATHRPRKWIRVEVRACYLGRVSEIYLHSMITASSDPAKVDQRIAG